MFIFYSFCINNISIADSETDSVSLVKINILSRHVRLLREAKLDQMELILPDDIIIKNENNNEHSFRKLQFFFSENRFHAFIDSVEQKDKFLYTFSSTNSESKCLIKLGREIRYYPASMQINFNSKSLEFYTWENPDQYAVDSACAEYESSMWNEQEAMLALAHVIKARYYYTKKERPHKDCDFCDLTHCQVYRGRTNSGIKLNDNWNIDNDKLKHNLFFHSRCGGRLFGTDVFDSGNTIKKQGDLKDRIFHNGIRLCSTDEHAWECSISEDEIIQILADNSERKTSFRKTASDYIFYYDKNNCRYAMLNKDGSASNFFSGELFRLKINRIKGWNFIKSNNYSVTEKVIENKKYFHYTGNGLGHGVGMCQYGALKLSALGYNRYEILEHYFPDIELIDQKKTETLNSVYTPYLSYCTFNLSDGSVNAASSEHFLNRKTAPGSIFKLLVALYLAKERPDFFNDYTYNCNGQNEDKILPDRCWNKKGHGSITLGEAIPKSCNLYFASLYKKIELKKFAIFFQQLCRSLEIKSDLPQIKTEKEWASLLAGLDYRLYFSINDYIKIIRFLNSADYYKSNSFTNIILSAQRSLIFQSLKQTFINGTASGPVKPYGSEYNYSEIDQYLKNTNMALTQELWGKTATIIDGTNQPEGYGMFIGGTDNKGIIVLIRKGNGHIAAKWAQILLCSEKSLSE